MKIETLSARNLRSLQELMVDIKKSVLEEKEYLRTIKVLFDMKESFQEDEVFSVHLMMLIDATKDVWKCDMKGNPTLIECDSWSNLYNNMISVFQQ